MSNITETKATVFIPAVRQGRVIMGAFHISCHDPKLIKNASSLSGR